MRGFTQNHQIGIALPLAVMNRIRRQNGGSMRGGIDQALVTGCHLVLGAASPSEYARPASFLLLATAGPSTPG